MVEQFLGRLGNQLRALARAAPGRTLTVCEGRAFAERDGVEGLIATMTGTLMALPRKAED